MAARVRPAHIALAFLFASISLALLVSSAGASVATGGSTVTYTAAEGERNQFGVGYFPDGDSGSTGTPGYRLRDGDDPPGEGCDGYYCVAITQGAGCDEYARNDQRGDPNYVYCPEGGGVSEFRAFLGDRDDYIQANFSTFANGYPDKPPPWRIDAGPGNDDIRAANGTADVIDCGEGNDRATAESNDTVTNCEQVSTEAAACSYLEEGVAPHASLTIPLVDRELLDVKGRGRVPFDLEVDGKVFGTGELSSCADPKLTDSITPVTIEDRGGEYDRVSFSMQAATWEPTTGVTRNVVPNFEWKLGWPKLDGSTLEIPVFALTSSVGLNLPLARVQLDLTLETEIETSVKRIATYVLNIRSLSPWLRAASLAQWLLDNAGTITRAYGAAFDLKELTERVLTFIEQSVPLAKQLGYVIKVVGGAVQLVGSVIGGAIEAVSDFTGELYSTVLDLPGALFRRPAPLRPAAASTTPQPVGTRAKLSATRLTHADVTGGTWRRIRLKDARKVVPLVLNPVVPSRIGYLRTTHSKVRRGATVGVLAGELESSRQVLATIVGPKGYSAEAPLVVRRGVAGARVRVPKKAPRGRYHVAVIDTSRVGPDGGAALVAVAPLTVR